MVLRLFFDSIFCGFSAHCFVHQQIQSYLFSLLAVCCWLALRCNVCFTVCGRKRARQKLTPSSQGLPIDSATWVSNTIARDQLAQHRRRPYELRAVV